MKKALLFNIQRFCIHDGYGIRTTIFFKGCNLRCGWCSNPESQSMLPDKQGQLYTIEEVMDIVLKDKVFFDKSNGGITFSGGEPLLQADFICALSDELHANGISICIETAANVPKPVFSKVIEKCDFVFIDIKHWNTSMHLSGTGSGNELILYNISYALANHSSVTLRIPIIPGFNDSVKDAEKFADIFCKLEAKNIQLLPFHQLGEKKYINMNRPYAYSGVPQLHDDDLIVFAKILSSYGLSVQIGG